LVFDTVATPLSQLGSLRGCWWLKTEPLGAVLRRRRSASALGFLPTQVLQRIVETALRPCKIVVSLQMPGNKFIRLTG
jgi:hypothetical protein